MAGGIFFLICLMVWFLLYGLMGGSFGWVCSDVAPAYPVVKKKKTPSKYVFIKRLLNTLLVTIILIVLGPVSLFISIESTVHLMQEWNTLRILEDKGQIQTVSLVETGEEGTSYYAIYEYGSSLHYQRIGGKQYECLLNETVVNVMVHSDDSRIVGTRPEYDVIAIILPSGAMGSVVVSYFLVFCFRKVVDVV